MVLAVLTVQHRPIRLHFWITLSLGPLPSPRYILERRRSRCSSVHMQGGVEEEEGILICLRYALIKKLRDYLRIFLNMGGVFSIPKTFVIRDLGRPSPGSSTEMKVRPWPTLWRVEQEPRQGSLQFFPWGGGGIWEVWSGIGKVSLSQTLDDSAVKTWLITHKQVILKQDDKQLKDSSWCGEWAF